MPSSLYICGIVVHSSQALFLIWPIVVATIVIGSDIREVDLVGVDLVGC